MPQQRSGTKAASIGLRRFVIAFNLVVALGLSLGVAGVVTRVQATELENERISRDLARTRSAFDDLAADRNRLEVALSRDIEAAEARHELERRSLEDALQRRDLEERAAIESRLLALRAKLDEIDSRHRSDTEVVAAEVRSQIEALEHSMATELEKRPAAEAVFRDFEARHRGGLFLIYSEFDYDRIEDGRKKRSRTVSSWGTGFLASTEGHIVTNKHVVFPWLFDADLAAMEAIGEVEIHRSSLRITAWPADSIVLDENGEPLARGGFNTHAEGNLAIAIAAPDSLRDEKFGIGSYATSYRVHELNDNDLLVLKASGAEFRPLPVASGCTAAGIGTLDPVMALGFPRGQKGLEARVAVPSASVGAVRKVENTIHISASIIPGNSGGPLIGPRGEVVGIVTRIYSETLGICIKVQRALDLIEESRRLDAAAEATAAAAAGR